MHCPSLSSSLPIATIFQYSFFPPHFDNTILPLYTSSLYTHNYYSPCLTDVTNLTGTSGMKLYGAALHVYELVEPEDLAQMLGHPVGT